MSKSSTLRDRLPRQNDSHDRTAEGRGHSKSLGLRFPAMIGFTVGCAAGGLKSLFWQTVQGRDIAV